MLHTRRDFLRTGSLGAAAALTVPTFLSNTFAQLHRRADGSMTQVETGRDGTILIVIQLAGGNDGLNTIVPHGHDEYHTNRPRLRLSRDQLLVLDDELGIHPSLNHLHGALANGEATVVQGVGYPNPNRSHFRSSEIWHRGDPDERTATGWIGRYFDHACQGADPTVGVALSGETPEAFRSREVSGISLSDPAHFRWMGEDEVTRRSRQLFEHLNRPADLPGNPGEGPEPGSDQLSHLAFIERTALDAQLAVDRVQALRRTRRRPRFPRSNLGQQLELISRMIAEGFSTRVYYASHGGFDTHNNQLGSHARQLQTYDEAIAAFQADLADQGNAGRVVVLTFSEFGRRVSENASAGTDHGAAAPTFLHGTALRGGLEGRHPRLARADLVNGDVSFHTDFRSIYATLLGDWLGTDPAPVLGADFPRLDLFAPSAPPGTGSPADDAPAENPASLPGSAAPETTGAQENPSP